MANTFSIIIPVYNDAEDLKLVLNAIKVQNFPVDKFEIFVVDNGSTDDSVDVAKSYSSVNVLLEHRNLNSPYSCRNRGVEQAKGDIIVLLDASCKPVKNWLHSALQCFEDTNTDILGGDVKFDFKEMITAGKVFDSITNIRMQDSIEKKGVAKTANLFIRKEVFKKIGMFPEGLRSGGDVRWTSKATRDGYNLEFCKDAVVYKTARSFMELLKKQWRVGSHQPLISKEKGEKLQLGKKILKIFLPVSFSSIRERYQTLDSSLKNKVSIFRLLLVAQAVKVVMNVAFVTIVLKVRFQRD